MSEGCSPPWQVVKQSGPPSALRGAGEVAVQFDYSEAYVGDTPMAEYVAEREVDEPDYANTMSELLGKFESFYMEGFTNNWQAAKQLPAEAAAAGEHVVAKVKVRFLQMGKYIPFALPATIVRAGVEWLVDGQSTDEIAIEAAHSPSLMQPSVFQHIGYVGQDLGSYSSQFLESAQE